jgi:2'-hydroxyisoflavone reductase
MQFTRRQLIQGATAMTAAAAAGASMPITKAEKPLHILILGGTGFTGPAQVRYALARGHKITLFNRGRKEIDWPGEVEELTGDREKSDVAALKGRKFDVCIDNPTSVPHWVRDVGKVLNKNVKHYIFISTISVYADNSQPDMLESAALAAYKGKDVMAETRTSLVANMELYGPLKAACEAEAKKQFAKNVTIIRPGLIVGPGDETDRFSYWPLRIAKGGTVLAPPRDDHVQFIDARDLAEWTIRMAEQRALGTYNATGPDYRLNVAALMYGIRAVTTTGADIRFATADFLEKNQVAPWAELPAWVPSQGETAGMQAVSTKAAIAKGLTFRPLATTAIDTIDWFKSQTAERQATIRAGLKPEREAELLKLMELKS